MLSQYVQYFTIGWNKEGNLVPIPVLAKRKESSFVIETISEVANSRQCVVMLIDQSILDDKITLDRYGSWFGQRKWNICSNIIHAVDPLSAFEAITYIKDKISKKEQNG